MRQNALVFTFVTVLGLFATPSVSSATLLADLPKSFTFSETLTIVITDATWAQQGDVLLQEGTTPCDDTTNLGTCSDVVRFVNVSGQANIVFLSDPSGSAPIDVTLLPDFSVSPTPFVATSVEGDSLVLQSVLLVGGGSITATIGSDPAVDEDSIALSAPSAVVPEPATLLLLGSGFVGLGGFGWRRSRRA